MAWHPIERKKRRKGRPKITWMDRIVEMMGTWDLRKRTGETVKAGDERKLDKFNWTHKM